MQSRTQKHSRATIVGRVAIVALLSVMRTASLGAIAGERPVAAERHPPGDIPDGRAFVTYAFPLGFSLQVSEGCGRTDRSDGVGFADKYNAIDVTPLPAAAAPTASSVSGRAAGALVKAWIYLGMLVGVALVSVAIAVIAALRETRVPAVQRMREI